MRAEMMRGSSTLRGMIASRANRGSGQTLLRDVRHELILAWAERQALAPLSAAPPSAAFPGHTDSNKTRLWLCATLHSRLL